MARIVSAREAAKRFGTLLETADEGPVTIHRHGRPRAAVLGWRLFEKYKKAYDAAHEHDLIGLVEESIALAVEGRLGKSQRALALMRRLNDGGPLARNDPPTDKAVDAALTSRSAPRNSS